MDKDNGNLFKAQNSLDIVSDNGQKVKHVLTLRVPSYLLSCRILMSDSVTSASDLPKKC